MNAKYKRFFEVIGIILLSAVAGFFLGDFLLLASEPFWNNNHPYISVLIMELAFFSPIIITTIFAIYLTRKFSVKIAFFITLLSQVLVNTINLFYGSDKAIY